jgi:hypothetical protein
MKAAAFRLSRLLVLGLAAVLLGSPAAGAQDLRTEAFSFNWGVAPNTPQPWTPADWDVIVHSRDKSTWAQPEEIQAEHGPDCGPPPATHPVTTYEDSVFLCKNHMMTAINAGGYGVIYFGPNRMVDFSSGMSSIRYRVSTQRTSIRDWHDIWITPFDDNLVLPLYRFPDLQGPPRNAVHIQLNQDNTFVGNVFRNFVSTDLPKRDGTPYNAVLGPSATLRTMFELDISRTHIRFGMPELKLWWFDMDVPDLGFSQGIVQLGHHSYNPTKAENGRPGTWHWSEFSISSAVPFTMLRGDLQAINSGTRDEVCFGGGAPSASHLRFAGIGTIKVSFDGGRTFVAAEPAAQIGPHGEGSPQAELFASYWTPIPQGTSGVVFRGADWWGGQWFVRDPAIWSQATDKPLKATSPCPGPTKAIPTPAPPAITARANDSKPVAITQQSVIALARKAGRQNLLMLGMGFAIAIGVTGIAGFALGRRRRRQPVRS